MTGTFAQGSPWNISPFATQGIGASPWLFQPQYAQTQTSSPFAGYGASPSFATSPAQQIVHSLLHIVPQQLQQLLQLAHVQQQQAQYLQQFVAQQLQLLQQLLPQSVNPGPIGPQPFGSPIQQTLQGVPGGFGAQTGYVM
jgi:hypothetical protein